MTVSSMLSNARTLRTLHSSDQCVCSGHSVCGRSFRPYAQLGVFACVRECHFVCLHGPVNMSAFSKEHLIESGYSTTSTETAKSTQKRVKSVLQCYRFKFDLCLLIHESSKSLDQLVSRAYKMLETKFFVGEEVYRKDGSGEVYTVGERIPGFFRNRYRIRAASTTDTDVVKFSDLQRPIPVSKAELKSLISEFAEQVNCRWYVKLWYRDSLELDEAIDRRNDEICACKGIFFLVFGTLGISLLTLLPFAIDDLLSTEDNAKLAQESMKLMAKMNRTTLNNYFKEVVANETINAVDHPLAAEGIAHMFWFESNLKNRTTLDEYVDRMQPTQQSIFYAHDHSRSEIEQMSTVQSLVKAGNEVLFVTNSLDKRVIDRIDMFRGKWFVDVKRLISTKNETAILHL